MSPSVTTFLFEVINVLLLVGLLAWLFFKPVRAALQAKVDAERQRRDELAAQLTAAEQQRANLDQRLRGFEAEVAQLRQARLAAATEDAAAIRAQAHEAVQRERESATRMLAQLERAQLERLSLAIAATTREAVARLLAILSAPDLEVSLVQAARRQLTALDGRALGAVLIESARPLDDACRTALMTALVGHAPSVDFRVVPDLGAGVRVVTAKGLIDASASGIGREAERALVNALTIEPTGATV